MENPTFEQLPSAVSKIFDKLTSIELLLTQKNNPVSEPDEILTITETAKLLNLSVTTIYGKVSRKDIPVSKQGKRLYFSRFELNEWIKSGRKMTATEIENSAASYLLEKSKKVKSI